MDGFVPLHGGEAILHEGRVIETVTSGGYGHTIGKSIAYGFIPMKSFQSEGLRSRELRRAPRGAFAANAPPYDPERRKITA